MATQVLSSLDFGRRRKLIGALHDPRAADPATLVAGDEGLVWYQSTVHRLRFYDGTAVRTPITAGADFTNGDIPLAKLATDPLARANHTGTQLAATISDLATVVKAYRLDEFAVPTADISLNTHKLTNVVDPTGAQDAATKNYVDALVQGLAWKDSVRAATTANGTLATAYANGQVVDGVTLATGDRILLKNQTTGSENGIYTVNASGAPTRATDFDAGAEVRGAAVYVEEGTTNADSTWSLTTNAPITLGTTALSFAQVGGGTGVSGGAGLTLTGSVLDVGAGTGITVDTANVNIDVAVVPRKFLGTITGDGATTSFTITHSLNNDYPHVVVWDDTASPKAIVMCDVQRSSINAVNVIFDVAPGNGTQVYKVAVYG